MSSGRKAWAEELEEQAHKQLLDRLSCVTTKQWENYTDKVLRLISSPALNPQASLPLHVHRQLQELSDMTNSIRNPGGIKSE